MPALTASVIILGIIIVVLILSAISFLNALGIETKDFVSFIKANQKIDDVYKMSKKYNSLTLEERIHFLDESKYIFDSYAKIPDRLWESEYNKYMEILDTYQKAKVDNWKHKNNVVPNIQTAKDLKAKRKLKKLNLKGNSINTKTIKEN